MVKRTVDQPATGTLGVRYHRHPDLPKPHLHRRGNDPHDHDDTGRAVFLDEETTQEITWVEADTSCPARSVDADGSVHRCDRPDLHDPDPAVHGHYWSADSLTPPRDPSNGRFLPKRSAHVGSAAPLHQFVDEVDQNFAEHERTLSDHYLLDLAMAELDRESEEFNATLARFAAEVDGLTRWIEFAEAAERVGHHPAAAYCYAADRFDPEGAQA